MDKVKLQREVAEAIDTISRMQNWKHRIMECMYDTQRTLSREMGIVYSYFHQSEETGLEILSSLVNGYEVEQTPEDEVREKFKDFMRYAENPDAPDEEQLMFQKLAEGMRHACDLLNIKIEGVNA